MRAEMQRPVPADNESGPGRLVLWAVAAGLLLLTIAAYRHLPENGFVNYDDSFYIYANRELNRGFTAEGLRWAFSSGNEHAYWHPLTWLSLMLDVRLFGLNPAAFHLVNLLFHLGNVLLLFAILNRTTARLWASAVVAALFALHPLNVENVAWAAERKTVLAAFLGFAAVWAYLRYLRRPAPGTYAPVVLIMALGLMAKPTVVILPVMLLLLDYWPLGRIGFRGAPHHPEAPQVTPRQAVREKLPLVALAGLSVLISLYSDRIHGRVAEGGGLSLGGRMANALVSYVAYLGKMLWPAKLAVYYPQPPTVPWWQVGGAALVLLAISLLVLRRRGASPWLLMGWLWYLAVLVPSIGIVRVGLWPAMADRFTYLAQIGFFIMVVWGVTDLLRPGTARRVLLPCGAMVILGALIVCTSRQTAIWNNTVSLFEHARSVTPDNIVICSTLGEAYYQAGDLPRAATLFARERELNPYAVECELDRGYAAYRNGEYQVAIYTFTKVLFREADQPFGLYYLAKTHEELRRYDLARAYYERSLQVVATRGREYDSLRQEAGNGLDRIRERGRQETALATRMVAAPALQREVGGRQRGVNYSSVLPALRPAVTSVSPPASPDN